MKPLHTVILCLVLLCACATTSRAAKPQKSGGKNAVTNADYAITPTLAMPNQRAYGLAPAEAADVIIARLVQKHGLRYDAHLAGAAGALGVKVLEREAGLDVWEQRDVLWQAGWPYGVDVLRFAQADRESPPPADFIAALATVPATDSVGLARVRGRSADAWVLMHTRERVNIGTIPRQLQLDGSMTIPPVPDAALLWAGPGGPVQSASLATGTKVRLNADGEWLFEIRSRDGGLLAHFPVYVGLFPPDTTLLHRPSPHRDGHVGQFDTLLKQVRAAYSTNTPPRDVFLDAGARSLLRGDATDWRGVLNGLGHDTSRSALLDCTAATITHCLDQALWDLGKRAVLLGPDTVVGVAIGPAPTGVRVIALLTPAVGSR